MANSFFYTDANGNKQGPLTPEQLQTLATKGIITPDTLLESEAGQQGKAGQIRGLKFNTAEPPPSAENPGAKKKPFNVAGIIKTIIALFKKLNTAAPTSNSGEREISLEAADTIKKLNFYFKMMCWCVVGTLLCYLFGHFLIDLYHRIGLYEGSSSLRSVLSSVFEIPVILLFLLTGIAVIAAFIFGLMLLYQLWKVIPEDIARTTPTKAVGLMCIPVFWCYWMFVAIAGLGEDLNKTFRQRGVQYRVKEGSGMVFCVLFINSLFVYCLAALGQSSEDSYYFVWAAVVLDIVSLIFLFFFFNSVKNGAIALLEQERT